MNLQIPKNIEKSKVIKFQQFYNLTKLNDKKLSTLNQQSVINTLATIFELNLSNNPIKKEIALIPYGNDLQVQIQEDGFLTLLQRSGNIIDFQREIITTSHKYNKKNKKWEIDISKIFDTKREIIGYFGSISIKNINGKIINFYKGMTKVECEEHRKKYSKALVNSPWVTSFNQMCLKTVIKAIIRDIYKDPTVLLTNKNLIDRAMQIDQSVVVNENEIIYADNPKNDKQTIILNNLENEITNNEIDIKDENLILETPTKEKTLNHLDNMPIFETQQKQIDDLNLDL